MSGDINWNNRPHEVIAAAKSRAIAALHHKHSKGLTTLERAYLHALKTGRVDPDD